MDKSIQSISSQALDWLTSDRPKRVLHVFKPVCNLIDDKGNVLSLVHPAIGNGPFSAVVQGGDFTKIVNTKSTIHIEQKELMLGATAYPFADAHLWEAVIDWDAFRARRIELSESLNKITTLIENMGAPQSFAELVLPIKRNFDANDAIFGRAQVAVSELFIGIRNSNIMTMRDGATGLAGLGIGLTPAGDDFLVGTMLGIWVRLPGQEAKEMCTIIANAASPKTNSLSSAWLRATAKGEAAESWHELLEGMARQDLPLLEKAVMRILPTGHTSGADALGGFVATMKLLDGASA